MHKCKRCGYEWISRIFTGEKPKECPRCKTYQWEEAIKEDKK